MCIHSLADFRAARICQMTIGSPLAEFGRQSFHQRPRAVPRTTIASAARRRGRRCAYPRAPEPSRSQFCWWLASKVGNPLAGDRAGYGARTAVGPHGQSTYARWSHNTDTYQVCGKRRMCRTAARPIDGDMRRSAQDGDPLRGDGPNPPPPGADGILSTDRAGSERRDARDQNADRRSRWHQPPRPEGSCPLVGLARRHPERHVRSRRSSERHRRASARRSPELPEAIAGRLISSGPPLGRRKPAPEGIECLLGSRWTQLPRSSRSARRSAPRRIGRQRPPFCR